MKKTIETFPLSLSVPGIAINENENLLKQLESHGGLIAVPSLQFGGLVPKLHRHDSCK